MTSNDKIRKLAGTLKLCDLPIATCVVTKEGTFIGYNNQFCDILKLPQSEQTDASIKDYFINSNEFDNLISELEIAEVKGKCIEKKEAALKIEGKEIWVYIYFCSIHDPDTKAVLGYLSCLIDITEEKSFQDLFNQLPIGVYQLDENDNFIRGNDALVKIFGYKDRHEIEGMPVKQFYRRPEEAVIFREQLIKDGTATHLKEELLTKTGETIFASINAFIKQTLEGSYAGRQGTVEDRTREENYRRILDTIPVGFYEVQIQGRNENIVECNEAFAKMYEFESVEKAKGTNILDLYENPKNGHHNFIIELRNKADQGEPLLGHLLRAKTRKGRHFTIEINARLRKDLKGKIIGAVGVVRDVSNEAVLREMRNDIGRVLHSYSSTLLMLQYSIIPVIKALGPDPFDKGSILSTDYTNSVLTEPAKNLEISTSKAIELLDSSEERRSAFTEERLIELKNLFQLLQNFKKQISFPELWYSALHDTANKVIDLCNKIDKGLPREIIREIQRKAEELEKSCCLISLHKAKHIILAMDHQVRSLREYVTFQARSPEQTEICSVSIIIGRAVRNLSEFARDMRVDVRREDKSHNARIKVEERSIIRALTNLLHNAIKYSWNREKGEPPWIMVRSRIFGNEVQIEFENYGVPIPKEEIEGRLVFQIGFRGRLSGDRGRLGTGIGLPDALETARKYGGDVTIHSRPAAMGSREDDYLKPFITTAILKLPLYVAEGE